MRCLSLFSTVFIMVTLATAAGAYNQGDVDRLLAGDKNMQRADLSDIVEINLTLRDYKRVDFSGADFSRSKMWSLVFDGAKFTGARLDDGSFHGSHFNYADFKGASLRNAVLTHISTDSGDFSGADLSGANLSFSFLGGCKLLQANLSGADLTDSRVIRADLSGANLSGTNLTNTDFLDTKIDLTWKEYIRGQNVRNFETIQWIQPQRLQPGDLKSPAASKINKAPVKPAVPIIK